MMQFMLFVYFVCVVSSSYSFDLLAVEFHGYIKILLIHGSSGLNACQDSLLSIDIDKLQIFRIAKFLF